MAKNKNRTGTAGIVVFVLLLFIGISTGCMEQKPIRASETATIGYTTLWNQPVDYNERPIIEQTANLFDRKVVKIGVVGDIMFHNTQLSKAYQKSTQSFDFSDIFVYMKPFIAPLDYSFANLETTLAGPYGNVHVDTGKNVYGYSGYPMFNTPDSVLDTLKETGFDFVSTANNHCLDRWYDGLVRTIEQLDQAGLEHTGTFKTGAARKAYELIEVEEITLAIVNYTYATNGLRIDSMDCVNTLDLYQETEIQKLLADIKAAKQQEPDFVIAMMHYGNEYQAFENKIYQRDLTQRIFEAGADIVFGGHPHVLQPIDIIWEQDGKRLERPKFVIYSLGNFISSQLKISHRGNTDLGVLLQLDIEKVGSRPAFIKAIGLVPTLTIQQAKALSTIPVVEAEDLLKYYGLDYQQLGLTAYQQQRFEFAKQYTVNHLLTYVRQKQLIRPLQTEQAVCRFEIIYP